MKSRGFTKNKQQKSHLLSVGYTPVFCTKSCWGKITLLLAKSQPVLAGNFRPLAILKKLSLGIYSTGIALLVR